MVDWNTRLWMQSMADLPEEEEQPLSRMSTLHTCGKSVWSQEFVVNEISCLGMTEMIWVDVDAAVAQLDAWEFLSQK
eukprot:scaffold236586_cov45-Attheya_sp.AAC.1